MKNTKNPLVSICCISYNHEKYISSAIEGFLLQKVNFPMEIIIHDDASTDRTAEIIKSYERKYPDLIKTIFQRENKYSKGINPYTAFVYPIAKGKYIALCEGDDYWTDPYKLQKQIDYLESHPDCTLCTHATKHVNLWEGGSEQIAGGERNTVFFTEDVLKRNPVAGHTSSMVFPRAIISQLPEWYEKVFVGDLPLKLICASLGYGYYIHEVMSVRLLGVEGSFNERIINNYEKKDEFYDRINEIHRYFDDFTEGKYRGLIEDIIKKFNKLKHTWSGKDYAEKFGYADFDQLMERILSYIRAKGINKIAIFGVGAVGRKIYAYLMRNNINIEMFLDNSNYGTVIENIAIHHPRVLSENQAGLELVINSVVGEHHKDINEQMHRINRNIKILSENDL